MQQAGLECESTEDVRNLFKDMVAMPLEAEWDAELGISKYDY